MYVDLLPGEEVQSGSVINVELENPEPVVCSIQGGCILYLKSCVIGYLSSEDTGCTSDGK